jgi:integrase
MHLFKKTYYGRDGKSHKSSKWYCEFKDHCQVVRRLPLFRDKAASEEFSRRLEQLVALKVAGAEPSQSLSLWIAGINGDLQTKVADFGLLDRARLAGCQALAEHLEAYKADLEAQGSSAKHVQVSYSRAKTIIDACRFRYRQDVHADVIMDHLRKLVKTGEISAKTHNYYLRDTKAFFRWMVRKKLSHENPLAEQKGIGKKALKQDQQRRLMEHNPLSRVRRAVSLEELRKLIRKTSESTEVRFGATGFERALIYRLAVETGLRASEIGALTCACLRLKDRQPSVTFSGADSKNANDVNLPLRADTVELLRKHLENKLPTAKAFNIPPSYDTAEMLRADLEAAGIEYRDEAGLVADFHALRHTFITNLAHSGVHPKVAMDLARHSDINLTMSRYSHTVLEQRAEAIGKLPEVSSAKDAVATGTLGVEDALSGGVVGGQNADFDRRVKTSVDDLPYEIAVAGVAEWQTQWIQNPRIQQRKQLGRMSL